MSVMSSSDPDEEDIAAIKRINFEKPSASDRVSLRRLVAKHARP